MVILARKVAIEARFDLEVGRSARLGGEWTSAHHIRNIKFLTVYQEEKPVVHVELECAAKWNRPRHINNLELSIDYVDPTVSKLGMRSCVAVGRQRKQKKLKHGKAERQCMYESSMPRQVAPSN